jgi:hypothetical protein
MLQPLLDALPSALALWGAGDLQVSALLFKFVSCALGAVSASEATRGAAHALVPAAVQLLQSAMCSNDVLVAISEFLSACCSNSVMSLADCCTLLQLSVPEDCAPPSPVVIHTSNVLSALLAASPACNSIILSHLSGSSSSRSAVALRVTGSLLAAGCSFPDGLAASSALLLDASSPEPLRPAAAHACGLAAFADAQVVLSSPHSFAFLHFVHGFHLQRRLLPSLMHACVQGFGLSLLPHISASSPPAVAAGVLAVLPPSPHFVSLRHLPSFSL